MNMKLVNVIVISVLMLLAVRLGHAQELLSFEGEIDFTQNQFNIILKLDDQSSLTAKVQRTSAKDYHLFLDVDQTVIGFHP